jgi:ribonuclease P protein component
MSLVRLSSPPTRASRQVGKPVVEEARSEANLPAEQSTPGQASRVPASHVDTGRPPRPALPPVEGSPSSVGLIWRVRDRATFAALRRQGQRVRRGPLTVTFLLDAASSEVQPPKVAFAVGRSVGNAVRRNRVRRQLREILRELAGRREAPLGPGTYLLSVRPAVTTLSYQELRSLVEDAMGQIRAARDAGTEGQG